MALRRREQKKNRSRKKNRSSTPEDRASAKHTIDVVKKGNDRVNYFSKVLFLFLCVHCTYSILVMYICALCKVKVKIFLMKLYAIR